MGICQEGRVEPLPTDEAHQCLCHEAGTPPGQGPRPALNTALNKCLPRDPAQPWATRSPGARSARAGKQASGKQPPGRGGSRSEAEGTG